MRTWMNADIEVLGVEKTEQGKFLSDKFDEIRVDQNGNYWAGFLSGTDSAPNDIDGEVVVK